MAKQLKRTDLHQYQVDTINHMARESDSMLWLDMGLGKTISALTVFSDLQELGQTKAMLVIAPLRVCQLTWRQEAEKWAHTNHLTFSVMCGAEKVKQRALFRTADIYLVNYESLSWLSIQLEHYFIDKGKPLPFDFLVFDEVSKVKRSMSKRFEAFSPLTPYFNRRSGLTASPCSNSMLDLWGQFFMVDNGARLGTDFSTFQSAFFHQVGDFTRGKWMPYEDTMDMIVNRINDITVQMSAQDHLDLPELTVVDVPVILPPAKRKLYEELERNFFIELDDGGSIEVFNRAALCNKLLQFSNGIIYNYPDPEDHDIRLEEFIHEEKYKALNDLVTGSGDSPILLAYSFSSERKEIMKRYPDAECLTGVKEEVAIDIVKRFNAGKIKLLIAHPQSAGHGLNLQESCHMVVWFGLNYNLELYEQFTGRIHRQGQKNPVQCFRIVCPKTMDDAVAMALAGKDRTQAGMRAAIGAYRGQEITNEIIMDDPDELQIPKPPARKNEKIMPLPPS